jgi:indole-3-glycerol phosphate synthase
MILDEIVLNRRRLLKREKSVFNEQDLALALDEKREEGYIPAPFLKNLEAGKPFLIAEIKKASPSKGIIREDFDVLSIAAAYDRSPHVSAISVLTEPDYFKGDYLNMVIASQITAKPLLLKDFIVEPYQIMRGYYSGASAFLVIASVTDDAAVESFIQTARGLGMSILFEVHTDEEYRRALNLDVDIIGINNRNLATFETSLDTTIGMIDRLGLPGSRPLISESGISSHDDIRRLGSAGVSGFLVGETFMRGRDVEGAIDLLMTGNPHAE